MSVSIYVIAAVVLTYSYLSSFSYHCSSVGRKAVPKVHPTIQQLKLQETMYGNASLLVYYFYTPSQRQAVQS